MKRTEGWAVIDEHGISVHSVSDSRRSAIVNWLVTRHRVPIMNHMTDEQIENIFWRYASGSVKCCQVSITEIAEEASHGLRSV